MEEENRAIGSFLDKYHDVIRRQYIWKLLSELPFNEITLNYIETNVMGHYYVDRKMSRNDDNMYRKEICF